MAKRNDCWGIEIGSYAIKAMHLVRTGGDIRLNDYVILPYKHVLSTPDVDIDEQIRLQLDAFLTKHDVSKSVVVASVPGNMAFARFAKLPPVEPKQVKKIVEFEAKQQIPFPIDQVEWDHQVFKNEDSPDIEVGIFAITKERVMNFLANFRAVSVRVDEINLAPVSVYNAFSYDNQDNSAGGTIYLDIGTTSTDVIIVEGDAIWLRTLPIGGNNFTDALVRSFKLSYPKAEKLKLEASTSKYARQIFQAMRPVFADMVQELQRSLGYYQSIRRDANVTRIVGLGSTFRLPGLTKFLKQQMQIEVQRPDGFKRINVDGKREADFAEEAVNLSTVYGLALQGLGEDKVHANLMPTPILRQRLWAAKQPWFLGAAAAMALAAIIPAYKNFADQAEINAVARELAPSVQEITRQADQYKNEFQDIQSGGEPIKQIDGLMTLTEMRGIWPLVLADLASAAHATDPQPELLAGTDYEKIKAIPRAERRLVIIESFTQTYIAKPESEAEEGAGQQNPGGMFGSPGMGGMGGMGGGMAGPGMGGMGGMGGGMAGPGMGGMGGMGGGMGMSSRGNADISQTYSIDDFFIEDKGPRFQVVLQGRTPHANPADFLTNTIIQHLRDNADRPDRPYKFVFPENVLVAIERVEVQPGNRPGAAGGMGGMGGPAGGMGGMGGGMAGPGMGGMGGGMGGMSGAVRSSSVNTGDLLPTHPLSTEPAATDTRFRIEFFIELKKPQPVRNPTTSQADPL